MRTWLLVVYQNLTKADTLLRSAVWLLIYCTKYHASKFVIVLTIRSNYALEYTPGRVLQVSYIIPQNFTVTSSIGGFYFLVFLFYNF